MDRNAFTLAALASAAVPGLDPVQTQILATPWEGQDVAGITGADGARFVITAPRTPAAGIELDRDTAVTQMLSKTSLSRYIPPVVGFVGLSEGGRAAVTQAPHGEPLSIEHLQRVLLSMSMGRVLAHTHNIPPHLAEDAGIEVYSASSLHDDHRTTIDRARQSGHLPAAVAQRWDSLLADDELWQFTPCFTHHDLSEQAFFFADGSISAMLGWSSARVGDPADDLAWLVSVLDHDSFDALYEAYLETREQLPDNRLLERAQVLGEFAVATWLLHGLDTEDEAIIADAREMLQDLEAEIADAARVEAEDAYNDLHNGATRATAHGAEGAEDDGDYSSR